MRIRDAAMTLLCLCAAAPACGPAGEPPAPPADPGTAERYVQTLGRTLHGGEADRTRGDMRAIGAALSARLADSADYPAVADLDALAAVLEPRYIRSMPRTDAWGNPFAYRSSGTGFVLTSAGPDGVAGNTDDLMLTEGGAR